MDDTTFKNDVKERKQNMDFLKAIFGDKALTFDELVTAINAHNGDEANKENQLKIGNLGGGDYVSKAKHDALQALLDGKTTELEKATGLIAELKKGTTGNEELQGKVTEYETQIADLQAQLKATQLESAVQLALRDAGGSDIGYLAFKLKEQGEIELDESGKIKGIDEKMTALKAQCPTFFDSGKGGKLKVEVQKLPGNDGNPNNDSEPTSLAEALKQKFEPTE